MDTRARLVMTGVTMMAIAMGMPRSARAQSPAIALHIQNRAGISEALVRDAEASLSEIFSQAGITVVLDGPNPLTIIILSSAMAAEMHQIPERMGFAPAAGSHIAYMVEGRVDTACATYRADKAAILAAAIAHELGHLLLPPHAHAPAGLMRADWNATDFGRASVGNLFFMPAQAKDLRKSLSRN